jgi:hypothetical protein
MNTPHSTTDVCEFCGHEFPLERLTKCDSCRIFCCDRGDCTEQHDIECTDDTGEYTDYGAREAITDDT